MNTFKFFRNFIATLLLVLSVVVAWGQTMTIDNVVVSSAAPYCMGGALM